jgi:protein-S-isoprenylcysteine O-methyltransferase Ste14
MWTVVAPFILLIASKLFHGGERFATVGVAFIVVGQLWRIWSAGCIQKDNVLATEGPFAWSRNPLYFGSFLIAIGYALLTGLWQALLLVPMAFAVVYLQTIGMEEKKLRALFGESFERYCQRVPRLIPRPPLRMGWSLGPFSWKQLKRNREWETVAVNTLGMVIFLWL